VRSLLEITNGSSGFPSGCIGAGDQFGSAIVDLGDLDGDTIPDLAVGAAEAPGGGSARGVVHILFMNADGTVGSKVSIANPDPAIDQDLDVFGRSLAFLGDLGPGAPTPCALAVGAHGDDGVGTRQGAVWILFLDTAGGVVVQNKIVSLGGALQDQDEFGLSCAAGDLDGDGVNELFVGAPENSNHPSPIGGSAWILFLDSGGAVSSQHQIAMPSLPIAVGDEFGDSVTYLGSLGPGAPTPRALAVGAKVVNGDSKGGVWIIFLSEMGGDWVVDQFVSLSDGAGGLPSSIINERFGNSVARLPDIDASGGSDLAVGETRGTSEGRVWVLLLNPDGTVKELVLTSDGVNGVPGGTLQGDDNFGGEVALLGAYQVDGRDCRLILGVGSPGDDADFGMAVNAGSVWILCMDFCALGGVNEGIGPIEDVLLINGSAGLPARTVTVGVGQPINVALNAPSAGPASGIKYVLWVWTSPPTSPVDLAGGGDDLGCLINPTPLHAGNPQPFRCVAGTGLPAAVCGGVPVVLASPARAPWSLTKASGLSMPRTLSLQGVMRDNGAGNGTGYSRTNAVTLVIE
jgi:hypothetical protein